MNKRREQEASLLAGLATFRSGLKEEVQARLSFSDILSALEQFRECVRYLNVRRSKGLKLELAGEGDVQDFIYLMIRPWVQDLVYENPTDKVGNRYVIKDFLARSARTVIEAKYIRDEVHGKVVSKELHDDIEMYRRHPDCDHLIFFIYDPDSLIPDVAALRNDIEANRSYDGRALHCHLIVP